MRSLSVKRRFQLVLFLLLLLPPCTGGQTSIQASKTTLRVALFPYIPDPLGDNNSALLSRIEREFEIQNPTVDLMLKPLDKNDDFYDIDTLNKWLMATPSNDSYDLVEVDTLLLGELTAANLITAWNATANASDWHPAARSGVSIKGVIYGIPHWLCGHFIFTRSEAVAKADSINKLLDALNKANPEIPNLAADMLGSWNLPALYLDAWADTYGPEKIGSAITPMLDTEVMKRFKLFSKQCEVDGKNPCIDGAFDDNDLSGQQFALGKSDAFLGYSERLNYMIKQGADPKRINIVSAPLGAHKRPLLFVDAFVLRRGCDGICQQAASRFSAYMNSPSTQEWILMSRDAGTSDVPRYLLPATISAFDSPSVKKDPQYKKLRVEIKSAAAYPNTGLPSVRKTMRDAILNELKQ